MTAQELTTARRPWWRRPWVRLVAATVIVVLFVVVIGVVVTSNQPSAAAQKPHALLVTMLSRVGDTAGAAGGTWTFEDKSKWDPRDTFGYTGVPCGDTDAGAQQYPVDISAAGVSDPAAAAKNMAEHWKGLGYTVHTVVPPDPTNQNVTQIAQPSRAAGANPLA